MYIRPFGHIISALAHVKRQKNKKPDVIQHRAFLFLVKNINQ